MRFWKIFRSAREDLAAFEIFYYILVFFAGASIGSFVYASSFRIANQEDFIFTRSKCDSCHTILSPLELIPIFSWLILGGKCKNCKSNISIYSILFEIFCAIYFIILFFCYEFNLMLFQYCIISIIFLMLALIDIKLKAVPDYLLLFLAIISLIPMQANFFETLEIFLIFCGGFFLLDFIVTYYIQNIKAKITNNNDLLTQRALGEGDMIAAGAIGSILGLKFGILAICLSATLAIIPSIFLMLKKNETEIAFIPFLALGFIFTLLIKGFL